MTLTIKDEDFAGKILQEITLQFKSENVTIREIITERVMTEVEKYNETLPAYFKGLVEPTEAEKTLNGFRLKPQKRIDPEKQVYIALDSFMKNGFFVLVDDVQSETLEQMVELKYDTSISFIKLTPLIGG